jgi:hypothetical protein
MLDFYADLLGTTLGALGLVNIFRFMAGVQFYNWRQVATAYLVNFLAAVPIEASVRSLDNGHPVTLSKAYIYAIGAVVGASIQLFLVLRRTNAARTGGSG